MSADLKDRPTPRPLLERLGVNTPAVRGVLARLPVPSGRAVAKLPESDTVPERVTPLPADGVLETSSKGPPGLWTSFALMVAAPVLAGGIYFAFIAANQYVSELQFAVRGSTEKLPGADALGFSGGLAYMNSSQEVYAVAEYLRSRPAIEDVSKVIDVREAFASPKADFLWRFDPQKPVEKLVRQWNKMVHVAADPVSGVVRVAVRAFSPDEAQRIAGAIRGATEARLNALQTRYRADLVTRAEAEVRTAMLAAQSAREAMEALRNAQGTTDPLKSAQAMIELATALRRELLLTDVELASARGSLGPDAPGIKALQARRTTLSEQVAAVERGIADPAGQGATAARQLVDYDRLEIRRTMAEQQVAMRERVLTQVRQDLARQQVYIDVIEGPTRPQRALFPERGWSVFEIAVAAMALWGCIYLTFLGIREHAD